MKVIKKHLGLVAALALALAPLGLCAKDKDNTKTPPGNPNCPFMGQGAARGGKGMGPCFGGAGGTAQGMRWGKSADNQGKGFRGGPRDGLGPRRDGSCGRCPWNQP